MSDTSIGYNTGDLSPIRVVHAFAAVLQQAADVLDARLVGIVCPRARSAVCAHVRQIKRRYDIFLISQVSDHMVATQVVAVRRDEMICR